MKEAVFTIKDVKCGDELTINFYENTDICINIENSESWEKSQFL